MCNMMKMMNNSLLVWLFLVELEHIWFCCVLLGGITQIKNGFLLELGLLAGAGGDEQGDSSVNSA